MGLFGRKKNVEELTAATVMEAYGSCLATWRIAATAEAFRAEHRLDAGAKRVISFCNESYFADCAKYQIPQDVPPRIDAYGPPDDEHWESSFRFFYGLTRDDTRAFVRDFEAWRQRPSASPASILQTMGIERMRLPEPLDDGPLVEGILALTAATWMCRDFARSEHCGELDRGLIMRTPGLYEETREILVKGNGLVEEHVDLWFPAALSDHAWRTGIVEWARKRIAEDIPMDTLASSFEAWSANYELPS